MGATAPRLKILSVGGNAVSAFLSWRLSATNACDVTLVWKNGFESVAQYGVSFKSTHRNLGTERFKPRHVVRSPEEAASMSKAPFDYVVLCVKALPDVYDLASVIESVVSTQHTCILVNTTHSLGVESYLESRFPTNVVLSLVCGADLTQINTTEFEHTGSTDFWVGPANKNPGIPASIQSDMAEALAMTLNSGQVDCKVSPNIRQQQFERMIGPIAFQPASVLFESSDHSQLLEKTGVRSIVTGVIQELLSVASAQGCSFPADFVNDTIKTMTQPTEMPNLMYQDYVARRPLEIETYLGSPLKLAKESGVAVPRIDTLYALLHDLNIQNQKRPVQQPLVQAPSPSTIPGPVPPRFSASVPPMGPPTGAMNGTVAPMPNGPMNGFPQNGPAGQPGMRQGPRAPSMSGMPPPARRGPGPNGAFAPRGMNGPMRGMPQQGRGPVRRPSPENDLEEFSHLMLYDSVPDAPPADYGYTDSGGEVASPAGSGDLAIRERELALRQRELALRERELSLRNAPPNNGGMRRGPPQHGGYDEDDDDDGDYFDPMAQNSAAPMVDPDNFDMMSVTSRRTRKAPSAQQLRNNPEMGGGGRGRNNFGKAKQTRASARIMAGMPGPHQDIMSNPMMGYSSNPYGTVDRHTLGAESRSNSLTTERLNELQQAGGPGGFGNVRRASQSPGNTLGPRMGQGRASSGGYEYGMPHRSSPPGSGDVRAPMPRHPPGHGNSVAPHQVEQQAGREEW